MPVVQVATAPDWEQSLDTSLACAVAWAFLPEHSTADGDTLGKGNSDGQECPSYKWWWWRLRRAIGVSPATLDAAVDLHTTCDPVVIRGPTAPRGPALCHHSLSPHRVPQLVSWRDVPEQLAPRAVLPFTPVPVGSAALAPTRWRSEAAKTRRSPAPGNSASDARTANRPGVGLHSPQLGLPGARSSAGSHL